MFAPFERAPATERYSISILLPVIGALPRVTPLPNDNSKKPFGDSLSIYNVEFSLIARAFTISEYVVKALVEGVSYTLTIAEEISKFLSGIT